MSKKPPDEKSTKPESNVVAWVRSQTYMVDNKRYSSFMVLQLPDTMTPPKPGPWYSIPDQAVDPLIAAMG